MFGKLENFLGFICKIVKVSNSIYVLRLSLGMLGNKAIMEELWNT